MDISYSSTLAQRNSLDCRDIYKSHTYLSIFPRRGYKKDKKETQKYKNRNKANVSYGTVNKTKK